MTAPAFWTARADGIDLHVRLTPKSSRDALEGAETRDDGARVLKARVRAVPEDGKANAALIALVAKSLKVPASRVKLASGAASRQKTLFIEGDAEALAERLAALFPDGSTA
ncbi:DUF167 family protein [Rhodoblastus acidophilus]|uniref:UPF0235 protein K2U94_04925 n=1 Tax=Candidatus Rhodoblastus alkanivorans TaxID=2954117 RepID=A0ABS9Z4J8_9HYPH|nr:DUF167 family protein [Candidatus Rhodoblastus alkanivorans]MCI4682112.1 DUF167 family protein [Candidatus Rhodoblastus alkanivorans]MDI4639414.1 DUF167 family protein [Rhodoblastus acidophilus]